MTNAAIERILELPQGYIDEHKGNDPALDHLLKIIKLYPWMITVAEHKYDPKVAQQCFILSFSDHVDKMRRMRENLEGIHGDETERT